MFRGQSEVSIDDKNRLTIPSKFREELGEVCFVTRGSDNCKCLSVFSQEKYAAFENNLKKFPSKTQRFFISFTHECSTDRQGRILLTPELIECAGLGKDVVVTGILNRLEIWDKQNWENYNDSSSFTQDEIAAQSELFDF